MPPGSARADRQCLPGAAGMRGNPGALTEVNATMTGEAATRRAVPREMAKILDDCRDLAIHRLLLSFASMLDRVSDQLMARAEIGRAHV